MKDVSDLSMMTNTLNTKNEGSVFIHDKNIQKLAIEIRKVKRDLAS